MYGPIIGYNKSSTTNWNGFPFAKKVKTKYSSPTVINKVIFMEVLDNAESIDEGCMCLYILLWYLTVK